MNLPSFADFKKNQATYYAFATILALMFIFRLYIKGQDDQLASKELAVKQCINDRKILEKKVDVLQEKLLIIVQKQSIKDSIK